MSSRCSELRGYGGTGGLRTKGKWRKEEEEDIERQGMKVSLELRKETEENREKTGSSGIGDKKDGRKRRRVKRRRKLRDMLKRMIRIRRQGK